MSYNLGDTVLLIGLTYRANPKKTKGNVSNYVTDITVRFASVNRKVGELSKCLTIAWSGEYTALYETRLE